MFKMSHKIISGYPRISGHLQRETLMDAAENQTCLPPTSVFHVQEILDYKYEDDRVGGQENPGDGGTM